MAGKTDTPAAPTFADLVRARDAALAAADAALAKAVDAVHVARAERDTAIARATADFEAGVQALADGVK